jgi:hypothetical protein
MTDSEKGSLLILGFIALLVIVAVLVFGTEDLFSPDNHLKPPAIHDAHAAAQSTMTPKAVPNVQPWWAPSGGPAPRHEFSTTAKQAQDVDGKK